ncbi:acyltransferase [Pseudomonas benzenivorans]|uniref:Acyltransferase n=1 Tax=Pseudomonas benzenivorans TaxID=556533 RepID=A0ABZ0Q042_9PSED|nr:acyltransferase [Pseudomonas benzenivorans]WPC06781.1 acyltransferase [Pseudomonas benzenivorans]
MTGRERIDFSDVLRGVAPWFVVASHWIGIFWWGPALVARITASPLLDEPAPWIASWFSLRYFNFGAFGVGLFFLISGLVIPLSVTANNPVAFVLARLLRILPTYIVGLSIGVFAVYCSSMYWALPFPVEWKSFIVNALLVANFFDIPSLDYVNWTLAIELKFYLLALLLIGTFRSGKFWPILLVCMVGLLFNLLANPAEGAGQVPVWVKAQAKDVMFFPFMFIGSVFYLIHSSKMSWRLGVIYSVLLVLLFCLTWRASAYAPNFYHITLNYCYALVVFAVLFCFRSHVRCNSLFGFLARISYPVYVIHPLCGYVFLRLALAQGWSYYAALLLALPMTLFASYVLHLLVEQPSISLGRLIGRRMRRKE